MNRYKIFFQKQTMYNTKYIFEISKYFYADCKDFASKNAPDFRKPIIALKDLKDE